MITIPVLTDSLRLRRTPRGTDVYDAIRRRWVAYTPEEAVRQNFIRHCTQELHYPEGLIALEKGVKAPGISARFDALVYDASLKPWMLIECKAPEVAISEQTLHQLLRYHNTLQCSYWVLYNGIQCFCADARNPEHLIWLSQLPVYDSFVGPAV